MIKNRKLVKNIFNLLGFSIAIFLCIIIFNQNDSVSNISLLCIFLLILFFSMILIFSDDIVNPFMFFFVSYFLGTWDIISVLLHFRNSKMIWNDYVYQKTLIIVVLWFAFFSIGYFLVDNFSIGNVKKENIIPLDNEKKLKYIIFPILLIAIYVFFNLFRGVHSITGLITAPLVGEGKLADGKGFLLAFTSIIGIIPVVFLANKRKKSGVILSILFFLVLILTGRRSLSIKASFLPLLIFWNFKINKISKKWLIIGIPVIISIVTIIGSIRTSGQTNFLSTNTNNEVLSQFVVLGKYIQYGDNLVDLVGKIDTGQISIQRFNFLFRGIEYFIPRSIWPGKPIVHSGEIISNLIYFAGDVGRPVGAFGWSYLQFGIIGVVTSGLFTGAIISRFYKWVKNRCDLFSLGMYGLIGLSLIELCLPESQMNIFLNLIIWTIIYNICPKKVLTNSYMN